MEEYSILTGKKLSVEKYLETWKLDNRIFDKENQITKKMALDWFEWSGRSTIVLWDNKRGCLVGYITPFLVKHSFANRYIVNSKTTSAGDVNDDRSTVKTSLLFKKFSIPFLIIY